MIEMSDFSDGIIHRYTISDLNGKQILKTQIVINASTTREEIISGCRQLQNEGVSLTFDKLTIRRSLFGILGRSRVSYAKGKIEMPNGDHDIFEVGGTFNFRYLKIYYSQIKNSNDFTLEMVEIIE